ncbi:MAG: hypothetical protein HDR22_02205 [Lachnospiraceae bacterium]|nr:hypothetical protein [Lachnospiraceae bacterium]
MESVKDKDEKQKLLEQLKYAVTYKKRDLEFAIVQNSSLHRDLKKSLELCNFGFKIHLSTMLLLLIIGKVFLYLIRIGDGFATSAFGLIYLICGVFYFGLIFVLLYRTLDYFMRWLENSDAERIHHYCEKKGIYTISMAQAECAKQLTSNRNSMEILNEMEEKLEGEVEKSQLEEWYHMVEAIEIQQNVPKEKKQASGKEKTICGVITVILFFFIYGIFF